MILTEQEAKKTKCPQSIIGAYDDTEISNCLGSKCMAWRWNSGPINTNIEGGEIRCKDDRGYCGLAGAATFI